MTERYGTQTSLGGRDAEGWDEVTVQAPMAAVRSIVTDDGWRLTIFNEDCPGEMFNLREDPQERNNLYSDPAWSTKRQELLERHARAYMQSSSAYQFRNLPVASGRRCLPGPGLGPMRPLC